MNHGLNTDVRAGPFQVRNVLKKIMGLIIDSKLTHGLSFPWDKSESDYNFTKNKIIFFM